VTVARLKLRVSPKAASNALVGWHGEALKLRVTAAPERGKANAAVVELLAGALGIPQQRVQLVKGETAQDKIVEIHGFDAAALREALSRVLR
jgi:uncharacterized protein (TIGR00251 family)